jgi:hypothetical protein
MTNDVVDNPWRLQRLVQAYETVQSAPLGFEDAVARLREIGEVNSWLRAEQSHIASMQRWLIAEQKYFATKGLLESHDVYLAAAQGWLAMRSICPGLDGYLTFDQLPKPIMDRYALFAAAVMGRSPDFEVEISAKQQNRALNAD